MSNRIYEVTFKGTASDALRAAFDDCDLHTLHGTTTVSCRHEALRVVLDRLQDLGLDLIEIDSTDESTSGG